MFIDGAYINRILVVVSYKLSYFYIKMAEMSIQSLPSIGLHNAVTPFHSPDFFPRGIFWILCLSNHTVIDGHWKQT